MGHPDPIRIKAYVDDLARLSVRHGPRLRQFDGHTMIEPAPSDFRGYCAPMGDEEACLTIEVLGPPTSTAELEWLEIARTRPAFVQSVDPDPDERPRADVPCGERRRSAMRTRSRSARRSWS